MSDLDQYKIIAAMDVYELLDYVINQPELLTDSYYRGYDKAIYERAEELQPRG